MTLATLEAVEEIRNLKARYARYFDTGEWDAYYGLFTDDAVFDMRSAGSVEGDGGDTPTEGADLEGYQVGRENIAKHLSGIVANISSSVHHLHAPEIEVTSPDTANGIWALDDRHRFRSGPMKSLHGFGIYFDTYVRQNGKWLIASTKLVRIRVDIELAAED